MYSSTHSSRSARPSRWGSAPSWPSAPAAGRRRTEMEPGLLKSAEWPLLIDVYFFLGGIAGGAFVVATIAHLLDSERYRSVVRIGYYVALLAVIPAPILLIVDLGIPTRFLHMLMVPKTSTSIGAGAMTFGPFHLKPGSPMSAGAWALLVFSGCAFLAALDALL